MASSGGREHYTAGKTPDRCSQQASEIRLLPRRLRKAPGAPDFVLVLLGLLPGGQVLRRKRGHQHQFYDAALWIAVIRDEGGRPQRHHHARNIPVRLPVHGLFHAAGGTADPVPATRTLAARNVGQPTHATLSLGVALSFL